MKAADLDIEAGPAVFSGEAVPTYRYTLTRRWDETLGVVNFLMLNPSTADTNKLDNTLRRVRGFSQRWGYGGFVITNLFAYRSRDRMVLRVVEDPVGPDNDAHILEQAQQAEKVICAWGADGVLHRRNEVVAAMLGNNGVPMYCIRETKGHHPEHPLFLPSELTPKAWLPS